MSPNHMNFRVWGHRRHRLCAGVILFLSPLPPEGSGEGPDCQLPHEIIFLGPIPNRIRGELYLCFWPLAQLGNEMPFWGVRLALVGGWLLVGFGDFPVLGHRQDLGVPGTWVVVVHPQAHCDKFKIFNSAKVVSGGSLGAKTAQ